ncbi:MAG TPA: MBL fold metallo-hydrolase [Candidatus Limnocylindrales bacterium]|nr:MBL fold metallo-hydrolase [Candidatus Limnocylindrales bacterium]
MAAVFHLLHEGYAEGERVGSSVSLVVDSEAVIVVDPGMVADRSLILDPLAAYGRAPGDVTHVVLTHHHPDHALNAALFPRVEVVDFWARYRGDRWLDHDGDGHAIGPFTRIILTPGHTAQDLTLLAETDSGVVAFTHCWWRADRSPLEDPLAEDPGALQASRARVLAAADVVVPGHGAPFSTGRATPGVG